MNYNHNNSFLCLTFYNLITFYLHRAPRNPSIHKCLVCDRYHSLRHCRRFLELNIGQRRQTAQRLGYCMNCLARSHRSYDWHSEVACQQCGGEHHTLLHMPTREVTVSYEKIQLMHREERVRRLEETALRRQQQRQLRAQNVPRQRTPDRSNNAQPEIVPHPSVRRTRRILQVALRALKVLHEELHKDRH